MTTRTVTAMYNSRADAERAAQQLRSELGLGQDMVRVSPEAGAADASYDRNRPYEDTGFWASLKDLFVPDEDRYAYAEGMRRGSVLVSATVDEGQVDRASDILEHTGAVDLDQQEATWRQQGWTGYDAAAHAKARGISAPAPTAAAPRAGAVEGTAGRDEVISVVEEQLVVGKREVDRGRVRVRSYVVERPVEEQVTLHDERIQVERRPVDRPVTAADANLFQERVIEATATGEEAVVSKEARVVEEVAIHKEAADRTETVRDTVRRTEVDVENDATRQAGSASVGARSGAADRNPPGTAASRAADRTMNTNISGTNPGAGAPDGTPGNPPGTMASRAVDKTLGTNVSGANPGGSAPDGTPGNPPGTMASRAVDKTLGTNVSGANPGRKP